MIGQPQNHRRRSVVIAMHPIRTRQPQSLMGSMEVVIEDLQAHQRIEGGIAFGEGMRLAGEGIEPIAQGAVKSFDMHGASWLHLRPQRGADFHREQLSVLIAMLDRLRQGEHLWHDQGGTSPFTRTHGLAIGSHQDAPLAVPAITEPRERPLVSSLDSGGHRLLKQVFAQRTSGTGDDEATVAVLDQTSPALSLIRLVNCAFFFCTKDQNSSIST